VFSYSLPEPLISFFPLETNSLSELRIISQLFDPLVKQSGSKGTIQNYLAKDIRFSNDGKLVKIKLKQGVLFHEDDCFRAGSSRELTAEDVAFTISFACSNNPLNQSGSLLMGKIQGSESFFNKGLLPEKSTVDGIRIINDYELEIHLTQPYNNFKQLLTHPSLGILSKSSWAYYGKQLSNHPVGSGPFYINSSSSTEIRLAKNKDYWMHDVFGNQLPYLDEVHVLTNTKLTQEYPLFSKEKVDLLFDLPANELEKAFGTLTDAKKGKNLLHRVHIQKASKIHYLAWNLKAKPFDNPLVRKAFHFTLDKNFSKFRDHHLSADLNEMKNLIKNLTDAQRMLGNEIKNITHEEKKNLTLCRRSFYLKKKVKKKKIIKLHDLILLRPLVPNSAHLDNIKKFIGKKYKKNYNKNEVLK